MSTAFPGETVIRSFQRTEAMLVEVLRHVPYCAKHEDVWSPTLATILLEACSQLDSLWSHRTRIASGGASQNLTITQHHQNFGSQLAPAWAVLWAEAGVRIEPFVVWRSANFAPVPWWHAYNKVKHDRLANRERATLKHAVQALCGLFLAIVTDPGMQIHLASEAWVKTDVKPSASLLLQGQPAEIKAAESALFSYLVGLDRKGFSGTKPQEVGTHGSYRFYLWLKTNQPDPQLIYL